MIPFRPSIPQITALSGMLLNQGPREPPPSLPSSNLPDGLPPRLRGRNSLDLWVAYAILSWTNCNSVVSCGREGLLVIVRAPELVGRIAGCVAFVKYFVGKGLHIAGAGRVEQRLTQLSERRRVLIVARRPIVACSRIHFASLVGLIRNF